MAICQTKDTLVDVGSHKLHFTIKPGAGTPIIFESGAGNDGSVWTEICKRLSQRTEAPLITYDRAGFGKSEIDTNNINITTEVKDLDSALNKLKFTGNYFFVAHSLGGNYVMKFISNNPNKVKGAVFIDIVNPYFMTSQRATYTKNLFIDSIAAIKKESIGFYHLVLNYENTSEIMRQVAPAIETPLTIIASGITPFEGEDRQHFKDALKRFAMDKKNRTYILAEKAEHYVFYDDPQLVIDEIIKLYHQVK
ncbi:alpha/beta hydrolase [Sphingobacterium faecium]|uniref:alpha/beta fold hydrolase n=1 Tax=Sphingobacterium faecium TaxID=34087 RepID=UPI00320B4B19